MMNVVRVEDPYCIYTSFREKPGGRVPCLALGDENVGRINQNPLEAEITGLAFQKVDTGKVKPVLMQDEFVTVNWPNAPTRDQPGQRYMNLPVPAPANIPQIWRNFTTFMSGVREALIDKLTPPGANAPESVYEGIVKNHWNGGYLDRYDKTIKQDRSSCIQSYLENRGMWTQQPVLRSWAKCVTNGLYGGPTQYTFAQLFETLFPNCNQCKVKAESQELVLAPMETSKNVCVGESMPHCLVYGFHKEQLRGRPTTRKSAGVDDDTDLDQRILMPKRMGQRARSRSRSPIRDNNDPPTLENSVVNVAIANARQPQLQDILNNPDDYELAPLLFHIYFEPHKPDATVVHWNEFQTRATTAVAKIVIEISSCKKYGGSNLKAYISNTTEQLVQSCLASFAYDQDVMFGLAIIVDGLKLIKIEKNHQQGRYDIHETDLICWNDEEEMLVLFGIIEDTL